MSEKYSKKDIQEIIQEGFSLEAIHTELEIPTETLIAYQQELEQKSSYIPEVKDDKKEEKPREKREKENPMEKLRTRYKEKYYTSSEFKLGQSQSAEENEKANNKIKEISDILSKMMEMSTPQKTSVFQTLKNKYYKILKSNLNSDQLNVLYETINNRALTDISQISELKFWIEDIRQKIVRKLSFVISDQISEAKTLEDFEALSRKLSFRIMKGNELELGSVRGRIDKAINEKRIQAIRQASESSIKNILQGLIDGNLDLDELREMIDKEVQIRMNKKNSTAQPTTLEDEKKAILNQVARLFEGEPKKYNIKDPQTLVIKMQELYGELTPTPIISVVNYLLERGEISEAKSLIQMCENPKDRRISSLCAFNIKEKIKKAEIGEFILKGIKTPGKTIDEDIQYFKLIKKGLEESKIKPYQIPIGRTENGKRVINLGEIWEEKTKNRE